MVRPCVMRTALLGRVWVRQGQQGGGHVATAAAAAVASRPLGTSPRARDGDGGVPAPDGQRLSLLTELAGFSATIDPKATAAAVSTPIFQTATFDVTCQSAYDYTRSGNPTRHALEELCQRVEHAHSAHAFTSGMAALAAVLRLLKPGDAVIASRDIYGGMHRLLMHCTVHAGITVNFVETWNLGSVEASLRAHPKARLVCVESPTNPMMRVSDIRGLAELAHNHGALLAVDNSVMSPVLSTPLELGADIVIHSATKYLSGHSDVTGGVVCVRDPEISKRIAFVQNAEGSGLAPFDSWLLLRGMKTMALRVSAAQSNAIELAEQLRSHPCVTAVHYLSPDDARGSGPAAEAAQLHFSQAKGGGALLSFETGSVAMSRAFVAQATKKRGGIFKQTVSFGSVTSLVELPFEMSHASIPEDERSAHIPADLVRLSVGIEALLDLKRSVANSLAAAQAADTRGNSYITALDDTATMSPRKVASELRPGDGAGSGSLPFGVSLPPRDAHAVGVSMPSWSDVIAYEQGCPTAHGKLQSGYPRFVFLQSVQKLHTVAASLFGQAGEEAMAMPSARAAIRLQKFMMAAGCQDVQVHDFFAHGVFAATYAAKDKSIAKAFWQHCGEIVSSRLAEEVLDVVSRTCWENAARAEVDDKSGHTPTTEDMFHNSNKSSHSNETVLGRYTSSSPLDALERRVAALTGEDCTNTFLYPTGMAAMSAVHRLLKLASDWHEVPLRNVVFGFPYLDTLKLNGRAELGGGVVFFGNGDDDDFAALERLLKTERIGGLFCEFPSNPLLRAPSLASLRRLADEHNFPIVADDSVAGFCNVDVLGEDGADILVSSLTKQFSGSNNAMGGSVVLNSNTKLAGQLHARIHRDYEPLLWRDDAAVLLSASADVEARNATSNDNTMALVDFLGQHELVEHIYHPSTENATLYDAYKRPGGGYGSLFSILMKDTTHAAWLYDNLDTPKGPGFGSNFTLVCPYTMIAHFNELQWCEQYGVDRSLIRVWCGLEDKDQILGIFGEALDKVARQQREGMSTSVPRPPKRDPTRTPP